MRARCRTTATSPAFAPSSSAWEARRRRRSSGSLTSKQTSRRRAVVRLACAGVTSAPSPGGSAACLARTRAPLAPPPTLALCASYARGPVAGLSGLLSPTTCRRCGANARHAAFQRSRAAAAAAAPRARRLTPQGRRAERGMRGRQGRGAVQWPHVRGRRSRARRSRGG